MMSFEYPDLKMNVSEPALPVSVSLPAPPLMVLAWPSPRIVSLPDPPKKLSMLTIRSLVALLVPDPTLKFYDPCVAPMRTKIGKWRRHVFEGVAKAVGFDINKPWKELTQKARDALLFGTGDPAHLRTNIESILKLPLPDADRVKLQDLFSHLRGVGLEAPPPQAR